MQKYKDGYKLSTGKIIYPNRGIIGLVKSNNGFEIYEGYDGSYITEKNAFEPEDIELTNAELKEIALYMSDLWRMWSIFLSTTDEQRTEIFSSIACVDPKDGDLHDFTDGTFMYESGKWKPY